MQAGMNWAPHKCKSLLLLVVALLCRIPIDDFRFRNHCGFVFTLTPRSHYRDKQPRDNKLPYCRLRIAAPYDAVLQAICDGRHLELLPLDQCRNEVARGGVFQGLAEGEVRFLPTYKFQKEAPFVAGQLSYDMGEKRRVPSWTDRIFFR